MKKLLKSFGFIALGAVILSSCSKKNITASFQNVNGGAYHASKIKTTDVAIAPTKTTVAEVVQPTQDFNTTAEANLEQKPTAVTTEMKQEITQQISNLSAQEKKEFKAALKQLKNSNVEKTSAKAAGSDSTLLLVLIALFIPPLAVYLLEGAITSSFWIDLILTLIGFLPGIIYALILIL